MLLYIMICSTQTTAGTTLLCKVPFNPGIQNLMAMEFVGTKRFAHLCITRVEYEDELLFKQ